MGNLTLEQQMIWVKISNVKYYNQSLDNNYGRTWVVGSSFERIEHIERIEHNHNWFN
jgi:hypothetical protein